jgi:hypothetical protein
VGAKRTILNTAVRAARSPQAFALAGQVTPFLRNGMTGAVLRGATRESSIEAVEAVATVGVGPIVERLGMTMLTGIDFAINRFANSAAVRADVTRVVRSDLDERALERQLVRDAAWKIIPGLGTGAELATAIADQMVRTVLEAHLILGIAHLRGLDMEAVELRRLDILLVLGIACGAAEIEGEVVRVDDLEISVAHLASGDIPPEAALSLGTAVGVDIVSRIARRRTAGILLRLLPGGASVAAAAWYDWRAAGSVGKHAIAYYDAILPARNATQTA